MSNKTINYGATVITVPKQDPKATINEGQWVAERTTGKFELATSTTPSRTRAWLVYRTSPPGCASISVVLAGYGRASFASVAALNSYTATQLNAPLTGGNFNLTSAGLIGSYIEPAAGSIASNRLNDLHELVTPGYYEVENGVTYSGVLVR